MPVERKTIFPELTGVRVYLATMVAIGHALQVSGFGPGTFPFAWIGQLTNGALYVRLFMILSGFVIMNLLVVRKEPYTPYIIRRFFRIFPAYALWCTISFLISGLSVAAVKAVSWQNAVGWKDYASVVTLCHMELINNLTYHIAAHVTMLHGIIPNQWLDHAATTILTPAWSISLEWQFYLIAPIALLAFKRPLIGVVSLTLLTLLLMAFDRGKLGSYPVESTLAISSCYFLVGMISRQAINYLIVLKLSFPLIATLFVALAFMLTREPISLSIWGVIYAHMICGQSRTLRVILSNTTVMKFGESSYSLYLSHIPAFMIATYLNAYYLHGDRLTNLLICSAIIVALIPFSTVLFKYIERPGEVLGRRVAQIVGRRALGSGQRSDDLHSPTLP